MLYAVKPCERDENFPFLAGIKPGSSRSAGQHSACLGTGASLSYENDTAGITLMMGRCFFFCFFFFLKNSSSSSTYKAAF